MQTPQLWTRSCWKNGRLKTIQGSHIDTGKFGSLGIPRDIKTNNSGVDEKKRRKQQLTEFLEADFNYMALNKQPDWYAKKSRILTSCLTQQLTTINPTSFDIPFPCLAI